MVGGWGQTWLALALGIIAVLSAVTVIQRIWHVRAQTLPANQHSQEDSTGPWKSN
jgi:hypothetical protein